MIPTLPIEAEQSKVEAMQTRQEANERLTSWTKVLASLRDVSLFWVENDEGYQTDMEPERRLSVIEGAVVFGDDHNESFLNFYFSRDGKAILTPWKNNCSSSCNGDNCVPHTLLKDDLNGDWIDVYLKIVESIKTYHGGIPESPQ